MRSSEQQAHLDRYVDLLLRQNARVNLTGAGTRADLVHRHVADALVLLDVPEVQRAARVLDLGTGGGLPGIPLASMRPDLEVTLLDATRKKVEAVQGFIDALGLPRARAVWGRAEVLGHDPTWRRHFDVVVARAVAPLRLLLEIAVPLCRKGGHVVAFKGSNTDLELAEARHAIQVLGCGLVRRLPYRLGDARFHLLVFRGPDTLPRRFPRDWKSIKARPL